MKMAIQSTSSLLLEDCGNLLKCPLSGSLCRTLLLRVRYSGPLSGESHHSVALINKNLGFAIQSCVNIKMNEIHPATQGAVWTGTRTYGRPWPSPAPSGPRWWTWWGRSRARGSTEEDTRKRRESQWGITEGGGCLLFWISKASGTRMTFRDTVSTLHSRNPVFNSNQK